MVHAQESGSPARMSRPLLHTGTERIGPRSQLAAAQPPRAWDRPFGYTVAVVK
jgi:hypothetical protein